ncbi:MAG TPA: hypothetical protein VHE82_03340 [Gemmatimonadaceae bacterium]|nr:hypothetical protein [Gemmatimonadaceae bacterium]
MTISPGARLAVVLTCLAATELPAQKRVHVPDDSIGAMIGVDSRLLWRDISLADALGLQSGIAFPVRLPRFPLQLELEGWTTLAKRSSRGFSDQYSASMHYQWILTDRPHPKSLVFGYAEYWNPIRRPVIQPSRANTRELSVSGLFDIGIPQQGIRTLHFQVDAARDLTRENATWVRGAVNASIGTTIQGTHTDYSLAAIFGAALSASDLRGPRLSGPRPAFGFHSADVELDLQLRTRMPALDATTTLQFATAMRANRLGANLGWVGLRQSFLFL